MTDQENKALYIAEQCRKAGMTLAGAAGVIANIEAESAFIPINVQDCFEGRVGPDAVYTRSVDSGAYTRFSTDGVGYGLAQWTAADRKEGMIRFHKARGESIGDFRTQVDWLIQEMRGYSRAWNTVTTSNEPFECGYAVCMYYEIPANTETQAIHRGGRARVWYSFLQANAGTGIADPETIKALDAAPTADGKFQLPEIQNGSKGTAVVLLQAVLTLLCYPCGKADGIFGPATAAALNRFKEDQDMEADGKVNLDVWKKLMEVLMQ